MQIRQGASTPIKFAILNTKIIYVIYFEFKPKYMAKHNCIFDLYQKIMTVSLHEK